MIERDFVVPGDPVGKGRPRSALVNGQTVHYTPKRTAEYEAWVKWCYLACNKGAKMIPPGVPLKMTIACIYQVPQSASAKRREAMLFGKIRPTKKPDADNVLKAVADALNGIAYHDDAQIVTATIAKFYGPDPCVRVMISEVE